MPSNFAAQVADWVANSKVAAEKVFHEAAQMVVEDMQRPGPSKASIAHAVATGAGLGKNGRSSKRAIGPVAPGGEGGRLPVDTGFLRASLLASSSNMPQIREGAKPVEGHAYSYDAGPVNLVINNTQLGGTVYAGYTAVYAAKVNYSYGYFFVELAAQKWPQFVKAAEQKLAAAMK